MKTLSNMRRLGCVLIVCSHFTLIYVGIIPGVIVHLMADVFTIPYFIENKMWDMVIMLSFLIVIGISKLASHGT